MARRIFYFSGYRMKVFEWHDRTLLGTYEFEPDADGFAQFNDYLSQATSIPSQLLVDLIEEDFRREHIPHVSGSDRKAVISRMIDRHYRGEPHVHVENLGRSKEGRRDDHILLSALTNHTILDPWLTPMDQHKVPLAGIWSLPLLSGQLLPALKVDGKNILILSRHIRSAQRESYFQDGKLMLSRQAKLDRDKRDDDLPAASLENLVKGTEQIHIFLTNQRIMGFTDKLNVYCILPKALLDQVHEISKDTNLIKYKFVNLQKLFSHYKLRNCAHQEADVLFSYLCASMPLRNDHYALSKQKQNFYRYILNRFVGWGSAMATLLISVSAGLLWLNSMELDQKRHSIETQRTILERRYQTDFSGIQQKLTDSANVQASVELVRRLQLEASLSPERMFAPLSQVFSDPRFAAVQLDGFIWKKYSTEELTQVLQTQQASVSEQQSDGVAAEANEPEAVAENSSSQPMITLSGYFRRGSLSYSATVNTINDFAEALRKLPNVIQVVILKMPVDVRPALGFADEFSALPTSYDQSKIKIDNHYEILIALKAEAILHE